MLETMTIDVVCARLVSIGSHHGLVVPHLTAGRLNVKIITWLEAMSILALPIPNKTATPIARSSHVPKLQKCIGHLPNLCGLQSVKRL